MTASEEALASYYAARAAEYEEVYDKPERQADLRAIESWLPSQFEGRRVLEVACGTGYWTARIARTAGQVVAVDAVPEMLAIARARVPMPAVQFLRGDAYALPHGAPPFDAAFSGFWISHVPKARTHEFLRSLSGALLPGARVVFLDNRYIDGSSTPIVKTDEQGNTYQTRRLHDGSTYRVLKNFPSEAELRAMLAEFGERAAFQQWRYFWAFQYLAFGQLAHEPIPGL